VLKPKAREQSKQLMKDRYPLDVPSAQCLQAMDVDGVNFSVWLNGENLHGNGNNPYFCKTRFPLKAILPNGKHQLVKLGPKSIHEDIDLLRITNEISSSTHGLGNFQIHEEGDYVESNEVQFCSYDYGCGLIDIGRGGPFLYSDRKTELEFNFKNFIFDYEPAAWNNGVSENMRGSFQVIDITSDCTGELHDVAEEHVSVYVNEIGNDNTLYQNVLIREKDDRVVQYYLHLHEPIKKGETVELLTYYGDDYEETRERKGYGKSGVKGDSDDNERSRRNILDRRSLEATIESMTLKEIGETLRFLFIEIFTPLNAKIKRFTKNISELSKISLRQWKARRRLSWLGEKFRRRLNVIEVNSKQEEDQTFKRDFVYYALDKMKWDFINLWGGVFKGVENIPRNAIWNSLCTEVFEENLFLVSLGNTLIKAFDSSRWCTTARKLIEDVAKKAIGSYFLEAPSHLSTEQRLKRLVAKLEKLAVGAASDIRRACKYMHSLDVSRYDFDCAVQTLSFNGFQNKQELILSYQEAHVLACLSEYTKMDAPLDFIVLRGVKTTKVCIDDDSADTRISSNTVHDMDVLKSGSARVNENWYLLWQIVRVIHIFATRCVQWNIDQVGTS